MTPFCDEAVGQRGGVCDFGEAVDTAVCLDGGQSWQRVTPDYRGVAAGPIPYDLYIPDFLDICLMSFLGTVDRSDKAGWEACEGDRQDETTVTRVAAT